MDPSFRWERGLRVDLFETRYVKPNPSSPTQVGAQELQVLRLGALGPGLRRERERMGALNNPAYAELFPTHLFPGEGRGLE